MVHDTKQGFTLIETIVTIGIIVVIVTLTIVGYQTFQNRVDLETITLEMVSDVDRARARTLRSENNLHFGVHFASDSYVIFTGDTYDAGNPDNETHALPDHLEIYDISLSGGGSDVAFAGVTGAASASGSVSLRRISDPNETSTITLLPSGQVSLAAAVNPTDTRQSDTRHIHFDLGWSIQGASTLTLTFSASGHVENVDMAEFFNEDETDFEWEETVDVNGNSEPFHINTHSLTDTDTELSIHRDGRENDLAVTIAIDDNEVVSYAGSGDATVGDSGGTMEIQ